MKVAAFLVTRAVTWWPRRHSWQNDKYLDTGSSEESWVLESQEGSRGPVPVDFRGKLYVRPPHSWELPFRQRAGRLWPGRYLKAMASNLLKR